MIGPEVTGSTSLSPQFQSFLTLLVLIFAACLCYGLFTVNGNVQNMAGVPMHPPSRFLWLSRSCWQSDLCQWRRPACRICMQLLREDWERGYAQTERRRERPGLFSGGQPDTDVICDRWAWDNATGPCFCSSFAIYGLLHLYYSSVIISKAAVQLAVQCGKVKLHIFTSTPLFADYGQNKYGLIKTNIKQIIILLLPDI